MSHWRSDIPYYLLYYFYRIVSKSRIMACICGNFFPSKTLIKSPLQKALNVVAGYSDCWVCMPSCLQHPSAAPSAVRSFAIHVIANLKVAVSASPLPSIKLLKFFKQKRSDFGQADPATAAPVEKLSGVDKPRIN